MSPMTHPRKIPLPRVLPLLLAILCASPTFSAAGAETLTLSVGDAVRMAVENNLGLQVATYSPAIAATGIRKARAIYDPLLSALVDHQEFNMPAAPRSFFVDRQRAFHFDASISQLLPTGATTSLSFNNSWSRDNLDLPTSRFAQPQLTLSFSQPLLQGLGREVTERGITTADDATDSALADWTQQALNTAAAARNQYLVLVTARESLVTRQASLALANEVQAQNKGRVDAGVLASYQLQDSRLGVLQARKNLLDAERAEKDAADQLRTILHLPAGTVLATTPPPPEPLEVSEPDAVRTALLRRPDVVKARIAVRTTEFNEKVSRNLALPSLALQGSGGITGLDSGYGDAFGDMGSAKYPNWSVGIELLGTDRESFRPGRRRGGPADRQPGADPARGDRGDGDPRGPDRPARTVLGVGAARSDRAGGDGRGGPHGLLPEAPTAGAGHHQGRPRRLRQPDAGAGEFHHRARGLPDRLHEPVEGHRGTARPAGDPAEG